MLNISRRGLLQLLGIGTATVPAAKAMVPTRALTLNGYFAEDNPLGAEEYQHLSGVNVAKHEYYLEPAQKYSIRHALPVGELRSFVVTNFGAEIEVALFFGLEEVHSWKQDSRSLISWNARKPSGSLKGLRLFDSIILRNTGNTTTSVTILAAAKPAWGAVRW